MDDQCQKHREYLGKEFDYPKYLEKILDGNEINIIRRYGAWMEALSVGILEPTTEKQAHFVLVARGGAEAATEYELIWDKYIVITFAKYQLKVRAFEALEIFCMENFFKSYTKIHSAEVLTEGLFKKIRNILLGGFAWETVLLDEIILENVDSCRQFKFTGYSLRGLVDKFVSLHNECCHVKNEIYELQHNECALDNYFDRQSRIGFDSFFKIETMLRMVQRAKCQLFDYLKAKKVQALTEVIVRDYLESARYIKCNGLEVEEATAYLERIRKLRPSSSPVVSNDKKDFEICSCRGLAATCPRCSGSGIIFNI